METALLYGTCACMSVCLCMCMCEYACECTWAMLKTNRDLQLRDMELGSDHTGLKIVSICSKQQGSLSNFKREKKRSPKIFPSCLYRVYWRVKSVKCSVFSSNSLERCFTLEQSSGFSIFSKTGGSTNSVPCFEVYLCRLIWWEHFTLLFNVLLIFTSTWDWKLLSGWNLNLYRHRMEVYRSNCYPKLTSLPMNISSNVSLHLPF